MRMHGDPHLKKKKWGPQKNTGEEGYDRKNSEKDEVKKMKSDRDVPRTCSKYFLLPECRREERTEGVVGLEGTGG